MLYTVINPWNLLKSNIMNLSHHSLIQEWSTPHRVHEEYLLALRSSCQYSTLTYVFNMNTHKHSTVVWLAILLKQKASQKALVLDKASIPYFAHTPLVGLFVPYTACETAVRDVQVFPNLSIWQNSLCLHVIGVSDTTLTIRSVRSYIYIMKLFERVDTFIRSKKIW